MFNIDSVSSIVFDSLIIISDVNSILFPWNEYAFKISNSNCLITNSEVKSFTNTHILSEESDLRITNSKFNHSLSNTSVLLYINSGLNYHELHVENVDIVSDLDLNAFAVYMKINGEYEKNKIVLSGLNIRDGLVNVFGNGDVNIQESTLNRSTFIVGLKSNIWDGMSSEITLQVENSTFSSNEMSHAILSQENSTYSTSLELNLTNSTFSQFTYYSENEEDDFFGTGINPLKLEGCIFNNITGFNELPIDSSGGYNLFGFPQTIGLHPTDLQNVSSADIDLGPLQNNGGFTPTHLPSLESIAFNAGNPNDTTDAQNGPIIQRRDIGAAEIQALKFTDTVEHCGTEFEWRDSSYTTTERFFEIQNSVTVSLDTVFELDLTLSNLQAQAINDWGLLTANEAGATYQWIDCNTNLPILGETNQIFEPSIAGNYQVIIDNGICVDTSACMLINNIGLEEETEPTIHAFISESTLYFFGNQTLNSPFRIYNTLGQSVFKGSTQDQQMNLSGFTPGVYFIEFITEKNIEPVKFVIE